jgi:hypothetical protein
MAAIKASHPVAAELLKPAVHELSLLTSVDPPAVR